MNKKTNSMNLGKRGYMLTLYVFLSFVIWVAFTNYPNNIMAGAYSEMFGWNAALIATAYSVGTVISVFLQFFINRKFANGNVKKLTTIFAIVTLILGILMSVITSQPIFILVYIVARVFGDIWVQLGNGVMVGQWFPTKKGTVMGMATFAFPIATGVVLSVFAGLFYAKGALFGFLPFIILGIIALIILQFILSNYPEERGCFRDNNPNMTKEMAENLMEMEKKGKANSVWTLKVCYTTKDFWFLIIPMGFILFAAVGFMVQIISVLTQIDASFYETKGPIVMLMITVVACLGSWILGLIDTKWNTKLAILIASIAMLIACIFGAIGATSGNITMVIVAAVFLAIFMGASSNFTVSGAASYWHGEDFPSVFAALNPITNLISAPGTALIAILAAAAGVAMSFTLVAVLAVISIICILLFSPTRVAEKDARLKEEAKNKAS